MLNRHTIIKTKLLNLLKLLKDKLSAKNYSEHEKSLGAAIGIFVGLLPISPLQLVLLGAILPMIKCYRALALITVWIANPFTYVIIYACEFTIGSMFVKSARNINIDFANINLKILKELFVEHGIGIISAILIGGIILSSCLGIATYFITKLFLKKKG